MCALKLLLDQKENFMKEVSRVLTSEQWDILLMEIWSWREDQSYDFDSEVLTPFQIEKLTSILEGIEEIIFLRKINKKFEEMTKALETIKGIL